MNHLDPVESTASMLAGQDDIAQVGRIIQ